VLAGGLYERTSGAAGKPLGGEAVDEGDDEWGP
jgi:hypothetical protein